MILSIHNSRFDPLYLLFAIVFFSLLPGSELLGRELKPEVVYFTDGSRASGMIVELNPKIVRIRLGDGKIIERETKDILRFSSGRNFREIYNRETTTQPPASQPDDAAPGQMTKQRGSYLNSELQSLPRHRFEVSPLTFYLEYDEPFMTTRGFMHGASGRYDFNDKMLMLSLSFDYSTGDMDYDGQTWGGTPVKTETGDHLYEFRALIGGNIHRGAFTFTPFIGFGNRYWNSEIYGAGGYERDVTYFYSPVGLRVLKLVSRKWFVEMNAEYDLFWGGKVKSHLSDAIWHANDPKNHQGFGKGHGMRFSVKIAHTFHQKYFWYVEPFFKYWYVSESDTANLTINGVPVAVVYEPENDTTIFGVGVGIGF